MSSNAHAMVVLGVEVKFSVTHYEQKLPRFDTKTGMPIELSSPADHLTATLTCPSGRNIEHRLPEDSQNYAESLMKFGFERWRESRCPSRINEWFRILGIDTEGLRNFMGIASHGISYIWERRIIGFKIADGCSGHWNEQAKDTRIIDFSIPDIGHVQAALKDKLSPAFGRDYSYQPKLFLITQL